MIKIILFTVVTFVSFISWYTAKAQWTEQYSGDTVIFKSISAVDNNVAWLCGDIQRVYRTTNGGTNWIRRSSAAIPYPLSLVNIFAVDQNVALVTGTFNSDRTFVFRTSNGGGSWTQVFTQQNGFINSIWMKDSLNGFMQGDPVNGRWSLWKTANGGITWDSTDFYLPDDGNEFGNVNGMFMSTNGSQTSIWIGTNNHKVYYSHNDGLNWTAQMTPSSQYIYSIWFSSPLIGMRGGSGIYKTSNSGQSWLASSSLISSSGIAGDGQKWWSVQYGFSEIYHTTNNGNNWSIQFTSPSTEFIFLTIPRNFINVYSVWAVGNPGKIFKLNTSVGIKQISVQILETFFLSQNYPNPFNPTTNIKFSLPEKSDVILKVYNSLGEEVIKLLDEFKLPGTYEIDFNGNNLESGVYYYRIEANKFIETKKMVLIK